MNRNRDFSSRRRPYLRWERLETRRLLAVDASHWYSGNSDASDSVTLNPIHGQLVGGALAGVPGRFGGAFALNGSNYVSIPAHSSLMPDFGSFSVELWFKSIGGSSGALVEHYECGATCGPGAAPFWNIGVSPDGKVGGGLRDVNHNTQYIEAGASFNDDQFHYLVMVRDVENQTLSVYGDGQLVASAPLTVFGLVGDGDGENDPVTIGHHRPPTLAPSDARYTAGVFDEVRIFKRALTSSEIQARFDGTETFLELTAATTTLIGSAISMTLRVTDSYGNPKNNFAGTVQLTSNDPHAQFPAEIQFAPGDLGVQTFPVTFNSLGARSITATTTSSTTATTAYSVNVTAQPANFDGGTSYSGHGTIYGLASGDFNEDGIPDLVSANLANGNVNVMLGLGNATYGAVTAYDIGSAALDATVADVDKDGHLDLTIVSYSGASTTVLFGFGDGTFGNQQSWPNSRNPSSSVVADLDGDNINDIVTANYAHTSGSITVIKGSGARSFQSPVEYPAGAGSQGLALADFDQDGDLDIATTNYQAGSTNIFLNSGSGVFTNTITYALGSITSWIITDDFNGDNRADLAASQYGSSNVVVLLGNGNGTFQSPQAYPLGAGGSYLKSSDINLDGRKDIVVTVPDNNRVAFLLGRGDGSFEAPRSFIAGNRPLGLVVSDLDGNGTPDIATADYNNQSVYVFKNLAQPADPNLWLQASNYTVQGTTFDVTVTVRDSLGNTRTDFTGTVQFVSSDKQAVLPSSYTFLPSDQGTKTLQFQLHGLGQQTITARLSGSSSLFSATSIQVMPPFIASAGGPYIVGESTAGLLQASQRGRSSAQVQFNWDLDNDGIFGETGVQASYGDEVGPTPEFTAPTVSQDIVLPIQVRVTDNVGLNAFASTTLTVTNASPQHTPVPLTDEILVTNNLFPNAQLGWENTAVAANSSGRKVVVWDPYLSGAHVSSLGISARVYNSSNQAIVSEFALQQNPSGDNTTVADVDIAEDGSFVAVWQAWGGDGQGWGIRARSVAADLSARTSDFQVNYGVQVASQYDAKVALLSNGNFVVTWEDDSGSDGSGRGVWGKVLSPFGDWISGEFRVNEMYTGDQTSADPSATPDGGFIVTYSSYNPSTGRQAIFVRRFNGQGVALGASVKVSNSDSFPVYAPAIRVAPNGSYLVAWQASLGGTRASEVYGQLMTANDVPVGTQFRLNTYTNGDQYSPDIAVDANGEYVVSWTSDQQDGSSYGVYAQRIAADGTFLGAEFRVNAFTNGAQYTSSVDFGAPGELVFSWKSEGQFSGYSGAVMRIFELTARNLAPVPVAGGPYTVTEGQSLSLNASLSTDPNGDPLTFTWDINGDGVWGDAVGITPTLSWEQLKSLGIDGPSTYAVRVQVSDSIAAPVSSAPVNLTAINTNPSIDVVAPMVAYEGTPYALTLGNVTDPGADTVSDYIVHWGDGSTSQYNTNGVVTHLFTDGRSNAGVPGAVSHLERADADTYVNDAAGSGGPNTPHGSEAALLATNWFNPGAGGSLASWPLIRFDLTHLGYPTINGDGTFRVHLIGPGSSSHHFSTPRRVDLYQITSPWNESSATWNTRPSGSYLNSLHIVYQGDNRWVEWTVPQSVLQGWIDHPETNYGLMLVNELPDSFFFDLIFAAREYGNGMEPQLSFSTSGPQSIYVDLRDEDGLYSRVGTRQVTVENVAPTISVSGPSVVVPFQPFTLQLNAIDPSPVDQAAGFRFAIDWNNDGTDDEIINNALSGITVGNNLASLGLRQVKITATDKDGGVSTYTHTIDVRTHYYLNGDLFIGGTTNDDAITVRHSTVPGNITALRNGTNLGTFTSTTNVQIFGGPGNDTVTVEGTTTQDAFILESNRVAVGTIATFGVGTEQWNLRLLNGDDSLLIRSGTATIDGGSGDDEIVAEVPGDVNWDITGLNAGRMVYSGGQIDFTNIRNLVGSAGNDTFAFRDGQRIQTSLNGGGGENSLDYSAFTSPVSINLDTSTASVLGGSYSIQNFTTFVGGISSDTLTASRSQDNNWDIQSNTETVLNLSINLLSFDVLKGNITKDTFLVGPNVFIGPTVDGGSGVDDTLSFAGRNDSVTINRPNQSASFLTGFRNLDIYIGGSAVDTWIGPDAITTWTLTGDGDGQITGSRFNSFEQLMGGAFADTFVLSAPDIAISIDGGDGDDVIDANDEINLWNLTGVRSGNLNGLLTFSSVESFIGGSLRDHFAMHPGASGFGNVDGGGNSDDLLDYASYDQAITVNLGLRSADGLRQFTGIDRIAGSNFSNSVVGPITGTAFAVNGPNAILALGIQLDAFERILGGQGNDSFSITSANGVLSGLVDGGVGTDTITGFGVDNEWELSGIQSGRLLNRLQFSNIENLTGNTGKDEFRVLPGASQFGTVNGGGGTAVDTLNYANFDSSIHIKTPATAPTMNGFAGIESFVGSSFNDTLEGSGTWTITDPNKGRIGSINFSSFENLVGGIATDTFVLDSVTAYISGTVVGGGGTDTLSGPALSNVWSLTGTASGTLSNTNGALAFTSVENLTGNTLIDHFVVHSTASSFATVNGGGSSSIDTLDYSNFNAPVNVNLLDRTANQFSQVLGIETYVGSNQLDQFRGTNANTNWTISGPMIGRSGSINFQNFESIVGGTGRDTFTFTHATARVNSIAGGNGASTVFDSLVGFGIQITGESNPQMLEHSITLQTSHRSKV